MRAMVQSIIFINVSILLCSPVQSKEGTGPKEVLLEEQTDSICPVKGIKRRGKPIPCSADVYTEKQYREKELKFNRRTMSEAYKWAGKKNPKWDDEAINYLEMFTEKFSGMPNAPQYAELEIEGRELIDLGCDDPLILYCYGTALQKNGKWAKAEKYVRKSVNGLLETRYPVNRVAFATRRLAHILKHLDKKDDLWVYCDFNYYKVLDTLQKNVYEKDEQRILFDHIHDSLKQINKESIYRFTKLYYKTQELQEIDPWLKNMIGGYYHIKMAWNRRGGSWSGEVKEEGWKGFREHLEKARRCLVKAWELKPDYPESAAHMISVSMGGCAQDNENERFWFDRAVSAQFDYSPAYSKMLHALLPRWGGRHDEMYEFGVECLNTKRFDTNVPFKLVDALCKIDDDRKDHEYWKRPGVYENFEILFKGLAAEPSQAHKEAYYKTLHAAVAWRVNKFDEAKRLLDELGDNVSKKALKKMKVSLEKIRNDVYPTD